MKREKKNGDLSTVLQPNEGMAERVCVWGQSGLQREDKPKLVTPFPFHLLVAVVEHGCTHQDLATHPPPPTPSPLSLPDCTAVLRLD